MVSATLTVANGDAASLEAAVEKTTQSGRPSPVKVEWSGVGRTRSATIFTADVSKVSAALRHLHKHRVPVRVRCVLFPQDKSMRWFSAGDALAGLS